MSQKKDAPVLIAALLVTAALLGGGGWWLAQQFMGGDTSTISTPNTTPTPTPNSNPSPVSSDISSAPSFAAVENVPTGLFNYGGSTTWAPIRRDIDPLITQAHPGFQLRYTNPTTGAPGSSTGIQMLINNQLAFAQSSRSLNVEEIQAAQQRGFTLKEIPVAIEGIAFAVHPDLAIAGLTLQQLQGIYTGQLTNWSQVGGPNLPITPYTRRPEDGGTVEFFIQNVLGGANFGSNASFIPTTTEALRAVSEDPGGIYYASAPEVVGQCTTKPIAIGRTPDQLIPIHQTPLVPPSQCPAQRNQIDSTVLLNGTYPITRRLLVVVKENGQVDQLAGETYAKLLLSQEGQQQLAGSGFVRIQ
ncbi:MAG: PstS family phosphate ABC transporter substrate-binding protein [Leptolyngbyaceae bacterium]|nr:PstS family phosphate ABC transporter substrate-binding protein [Leptolyngbyaceae bacterium]